MQTNSVFGGLRIIEFSEGMAGSMVGMMLADYGAEVIKIQNPVDHCANANPGFLMWDRGKRSVALNLAMPADLSKALDLAASADVVIESSDSLDQLPAITDLRSLCNSTSSGLIYCAISSFGPVKGLNVWPRNDAFIMAKTGRMRGNDDVSGSHYEVDRPVFLVPPTCSYGAAMLAMQGISAALIARHKSGRGQFLETSLLEGMLATTMRMPFEREGENLVHSKERVMQGHLRHRGIALTFLTAKCSDGKFIQMCARQDHHFHAWLSAMGLEGMLQDERFKDAPLGMKSEEDIEDLKREIKKAMATKSQSEWMKLFTETYDVGADPFLTPEEFLTHPQMTENARVIELADAKYGSVRQVGPLALMSLTPARITRSAPALGADQEILSNLAPPPEASVAAPANSSDAANVAPLAGKTILEIAYFLAAPLGLTLLAELGARVIKLEPLSGDSFRRAGTEFVHLVQGKESVAVDLKTPQGREILHRLVLSADALVHNFRPGVPERLGIDYGSVSKLNPRLVYLCGASYGTRGPQSRRPAFHSTPNALSGGGIAQGGEGNDPIDDSYPDTVAGMAVGTALAMGLYAQMRTGQGQYIETTMLCSTGYVHSERLTCFEGAPSAPILDGEQRGLNALQRLYPCADGWLYLAVGSDLEWAKLCNALERPDWLAQYRFLGITRNVGSCASLMEELNALFLSATAAYWETVLTSKGIAATQVGNSVEQFFVDTGLVHPAHHPAFGNYWRLPTRVRMQGNQDIERNPAAIGEHTAAVLSELGYSKEKISEFSQASVIKTI